MKTEMDDKKEEEKSYRCGRKKSDRVSKDAKDSASIKITFSKFLKQVRQKYQYIPKRKLREFKTLFWKKKKAYATLLDYMPNKCGMLMTYHK